MPTVDEMVPAAVVPITAFGSAKFVWLKTLNDSARNCICTRSVTPQPGEQERYVSVHPGGQQTPPTQAYALVTRIPGLHDRGHVLAFGAVSDVALWGAVQYLTEPELARELVAKMRAGQSALPTSYQAVLHVRIQGQVPLKVDYVTHRALTP